MGRKKKYNDVLYVQLGKRRNGKIVKAENYEVNSFLDECLSVLKPVKVKAPRIKWYDKLFNTKKKQYVDELLRQVRVINTYKAILKIGMCTLIKQDEFGRKKK